MGTARWFATASMLPSGKVLVAGGFDGTSYLTSAQVYDPTTNTWSSGGTFTGARYLARETSLSNGKVLLTGGYGGSYLSSAQLYDPGTNTWSSAGAMSSARYLHAAVYLSTGKVLVTGGWTGSAYLATADLYNPTNNTWSGAHVMGTARNGHTAVLLSNNKVLVAGGFNGSYLATTELYDASTDTWSTAASMSGARALQTAVTLTNAKVLVAGGQGASYLLTTELYDPTTNTWASSGSLATGRVYHGSTVLGNGKVVVSGGYNGSYLDAAELYDPAENAWSWANSITTGIYQHTATLLSSGKVLVTGGGTAPATGQTATTQIYNPLTYAWTSGPVMSSVRQEHTATLMNGKVLVVGGTNPTGYIASSELYDPTTNTWAGMASAHTPRARHTATLLNSGKLLIVGGSAAGGPTSSVETYDASTNAWTIQASLPTGVRQHSATLLGDGTVLIAGGYAYSAPVATCWIYDPVGNTWTSTGAMSSARYLHTAVRLANGKVLVAGGANATQYFSTAELFDPALGTWSSAGSMSSIHFAHAMTTLSDGKVLVAGGYTGSAFVAASDVYDPSTNAWLTATPMNTARDYFTATPLAGGTVLAAFGATSGSYLATAEIYTPVAADDGDPCTTDTWNATLGNVTHTAAPAGTHCADDGNPCTTDTCDGAGTCTHTNRPTGDSCGAGYMCYFGSCIYHYCYIGGTVYYQGDLNPANSCQACLADTSTTQWSNLGNGAACPSDGNACTNDVCDGSGSCTHAAVALGTSCGTNLVCNGTSCSSGCVIGGVFYTANTINTNNACQICTPGTSTSAWSPRTNGTTCDDGVACTHDDVCTAGTCAGVAYACTPTTCQMTSVCNGNGGCTVTNKTSGTACTDDGNVCTTDTCDGAGTCTHPVLANGTSCGAGTVCDTGSCTAECFIGGSLHAAGTSNPANACQVCTPATSTTAWTNKPNQTVCNDGNACTHDDVCTAGTCAGVAYTCTATTCQASSACNGNGGCTVTNKTSGSACTDDGNVCTTDTCDGAGTCTHPVLANGASCGAGTVCDTGSCTAECFIGGSLYAAGAANPANACQVCTPSASTSAWSNRPNGTACNDGNACTQTDACQAGVCTGSNPVSCTASDQCHNAGTCDPGTGVCSNPNKADGTTCDDADANTTGDVCTNGSCAGIDHCLGVTCAALDQCHVAGICVDHATGACSNPNKADGSSCNDGKLCTTADACVAGVCTGTPKPAGTSCGDGNPCNGTEQCNATGDCLAGSLNVMVEGALCNDNVCAPKRCDAAHQCVPQAGSTNGVACGDGSLCQANATCQNGACNLAADDGTTCSDLCQGGGTCLGGGCQVGTPVEIDDNDAGTLDTCDPATGIVSHAPISDLVPTVVTDVGSSTAFLYTGSSPVQLPADALTPIVIDPTQAAALRGQVFDTSSNALASVQITIVDHPEFGKTATQPTGYFDMAVNGGGQLTVQYAKEGYLTVQRPIDARWQEYSLLPDVVMTRLDSSATTVVLDGTATAYTMHEASSVSDVDGVRHAALLFPPGTTATGLPPGTTEVTVRATEFTVGDTGRNAMPGPLPPATGYTYAAEFSIDEANGETVTFNHDVLFYVENFIGFPVGGIVPFGYYDRKAGVWVPSKNGKVIKIVSHTNGMADLDLGGAQYGELDPPITDEERGQLLSYPIGQTLWRVPVPHFTPWDANWPYGPPAGACQPTDGNCAPGNPASPNNPDKGCNASGSIIECQSQILGERIPVVGTPHTLNYRSDRVPGRKEAFTLEIPLIKDNGPPGVERVTVGIEIAGRRFTEVYECPCSSLKPFVWTWDGLDAHGRVMQGPQPVSVGLSYTYPAQYYPPAEFAASFASPTGISGGGGGGGTVVYSGDHSQNKVTMTKPWTGMVGAWDQRGEGLGGWSLSAHHVYDPAGRMVRFGDGTRRRTEGIRPIIKTAWEGEPKGVVVLPNGYVIFTDGTSIRKLSPAGVVSTVQTSVSSPEALALAPDGSLYVSTSTGVIRVYKVNLTSGAATLVAGNGACNGQHSCGEGGPASAALIDIVNALSVGPDGSLYIADRYRVWRVTTDGMIHSIAGPGVDCSTLVDGSLAASGFIGHSHGVYAAADGIVYVSTTDCTSGRGRIRTVKPDGTVGTVAGTENGAIPLDLDGVPATSARLNAVGAIAMTADGKLVFVEHNRLRQVDSAGILTTIAAKAPCSSGGFCGDGVFALQSSLGVTAGIAFAPDGSLLVAGQAGGVDRLLRMSSPLPRFGLGTLEIPAEDGSELYVFDATGRHLRTMDTLTNATRYQFDYEPGGSRRLTSITYLPGAQTSPLVTTISYDDEVIKDLTHAWIVGPFGDTTRLAIDFLGNLRSSTNDGGTTSAPRDETYTFEVDAWLGGLLTGFRDPNGTASANKDAMWHQFGYDWVWPKPTGRLTSDADPEGGNQTLALATVVPASGVRTDRKVTRTTTGDNGQLYSSVYEISVATDDTETRTNTSSGASGRSIQKIDPDGTQHLTMPDGTTIDTQYFPDSRFGMLAPTSLTTTVTGGLTRSELVLRYQSGTVLYVDDTINPASSNERFRTTYDSATHIVTHTTPGLRTWTETLDAYGRVTGASVPGLGTTAYEYDPARGQLKKTTRHAAGTSVALDRIVERSFNLPGAGTGTAGRLASVTAHDGDNTVSVATSFTSYDRAGRVLGSTLPGARAISSSYDRNGNLLELVTPQVTPSFGSADRLQASHQFSYTALDQLQTYEIHDDQSNVFAPTSYLYTPDRLLKTTTLPDVDGALHNLQVTTTSSNGRLNTMTLPGGYGAIGLTYDAATGQLTDLSGPSLNVGLHFGYAGALVTDVTATQPGASYALHREYDTHFRVASETLNTSQAVYLGYDADSLVNCVGLGTLPGAGCTGGLSLNRTAGSFLLHDTTFPVGGSTPITETYTPNGFGEVLDYAATRNSATLYAFDFGHDTLGHVTGRDGLGRIVAKAEIINGVATDFNYSYDAAGRLTDVTSPAGHVVYEYDANGNRLRRTVNGANEELGTYNVQDQLLSYAGRSYTYTASGMLSRVDDATSGTTQTTKYFYDALGNLRRVELPNLQVIEYLIDGQSRRVGKLVGTTTVTPTLVKAWIYEDQLRIAAEVDVATSHVTRFAYGSKSNVPDLMIKSDGTRYRILSDHLGSPRMVVAESDGAITGRVDYDEFGRVVAGSPAVPFGFAGGLTDEHTGLVRFGARDYDSRTGRWTAKEPLGPVESANAYAYAADDPINFHDADGLAPSREDLTALAELLGVGSTAALINDYNAALDALSHGDTAAATCHADNILKDTAQGVAELGIAAALALRKAPESLVQVSRWGREGLRPGDWVMKGGPTYSNYFLSGKWQPGLGNEFAAFSTGRDFFVPSWSLRWPSGWEAWKGILGQRIYRPLLLRP